MILEINIINQSKIKVPSRFIKKWVLATVSHLPIRLRKQVSGKILNIVFLDQAAARRLNHNFRKKNYATDILSFDPIDSSEMGELVLCPLVLKRQAKEHGLLEREELGYMLIHGCLHLLGYDHEHNERDAKKMFRLQDKIFAKLM